MDGVEVLIIWKGTVPKTLKVEKVIQEAIFLECG